ncbi:CPBP family intramembrane glutamic endopeptidase [Mesorhizobium sp. M0051]|uniref:CPBP family intramembrane glutamic endopeptidase n=1 Tax=Mesorhizobium sp. M0051 TaxID=2956862 RepID=UPI003336CA10
MGAFNLVWLRWIYKRYPRGASLFELLFLIGLLVTYLWIVPLWFWSIYRLNIAVPDSVSAFFYEIWLEKNFIRSFLIASIVCFILASIYIRRTSPREMGLTTRNIWISGRDCIYLVLIICICAIAIMAISNNYLSIDGYLSKQKITGRTLLSDIFVAILSGTAQQFLLQSFILQRTLAIFRNKPTAILCSSFVFCLIHAPNIILMVATMIFGTACSFLFIRNRNIFTIGIMHGVVQQALRIFLASIILSGSYLDGRGYFTFDLSVGPPKGYPAYLAELEYKGSLPLAQSAAGGVIIIPVLVANKSTKTWSSTDKRLSGVGWLSPHRPKRRCDISRQSFNALRHTN